MLRGNFVQMNIDRPVYTKIGIMLYYHNGFRHLRGCLFDLSGVPKKKQMLGLAIAGRNGISVEIHQILAGVDIFFFMDGVYISVKLLRTRPVLRVCYTIVRQRPLDD